ncbi:potassium/proton antiporter [Ornithinibacillus halophilus]|uniref:Potassium/proton antiporter, CPA1 family n=1 Tax=Ornithinibacillus halophilus TaxID=930117 RepID=A0A1M5EUT8_9BACI|nr:potassium/proton antiporter [Ornithinibacillus halophilus]SHF82994.1 potassium/proton antiporter, CPA1 family [Ornithinibacillus halophilus]
MNGTSLIFDYFILTLGLLLIIGVLTAKFSNRLGVPALVLFILVGMVIGSDGLGLIHFSDDKLARMIGMAALVIILFDGGLQTKWTTVKPVIAPSLSLATIGVIFTSVIVGIGAKFILDVSWFEGLLFGSIVGSTDAAAVFAVLKGKNIKNRISSTLEAESGSNDPMAMILMITFIELITTEQQNYLYFVGSFFWQMIIGLLLGLIIGRLAVFAINKINLDSSGLYPVFTLAFALLTFSITDFINASGLLAVYISAVLIGNSDIAYRHSIFRFNEGFSWIAQILMFTILGLLVFPKQVFTLDIIIKGLLLSFILILIARPIAVFLSTIKLGFNFKEKAFLSWAGLKGAVPIVLATFPMAAGLENSQVFFNIIFFIVLISALIQGSTISILAEKLGLTGPKRTEPMHSLELVSIGKANAEMVEYEVNEEGFITGKSLTEIDFPENVLINAIIRNDELITPSGDTKIEVGDILYILVSRKSKKSLKQLLNK